MGFRERATLMPRIFRWFLAAFIGSAWVAALVIGATELWRYDSAEGVPASAPLAWPADTHIVRQHGLPELVVLIHPKCPCTRATIGELGRLMTDCQGKLAATVLVLHPANMPAGWEKTDLWTSAAAIPGVSVIADDQGTEIRRFGAATSGQALLYSADGRLLFSGGITESRGHSGDNAGRSAITSIVLGSAARPKTPLHTPVYGCSLFDGSGACRNN